MQNYNWEVSSDEKSRILNLHESATKRQYLKEQSEQPFTVDFNNTFASGRYEFTPNFESVVNDKVTQIVNYIKSLKNVKNFKIVITPGESQVRNQINPETGVRFGVGELAKKRAEVLKGYLEKVLTSSLSVTPIVEVAQSIIGQTKPGFDRNDPRYVAEQFVKVSVIVTAKQPQKFKATASYGEPIYMNQVLVGFAKIQTRDSKSITDPGHTNTNEQNVLFTEVKKDTQPPVPIGQALVPYSWWNRRTNATTNTITLKDLNYIRSFYFSG